MTRIDFLRTPVLFRLLSPLPVAVAAVGAASVCAQTAPAPSATQAVQPTQPHQSVVVTGSLREAALLDAPYAITTIDAQALRNAGPLVNLSEALGSVPGLVVAQRNNYAQDLQISARGFGARAGFGVRGLRLYADGIPATGPDGQGQVAHFDLAGAARIEVLRGPFSALYGNSSGGVIALVSALATEGRVELAADAGSFGLRQGRLSFAAPFQGGDVAANVSHLELDGFRPQSAATRSLGNLRLSLGQGADRITLVISDHRQRAQDPLGLSRAQFDADPRQTAPQATQFDTRKTVAQVQAGARWRHLFEGDGALRELSLAGYQGARDVTQWLAIAPATQANVRHGGGVVDFNRVYEGAELRLRWQLGPAELATGAVFDRQADDRRGYENFVGTGAAQVLGVTGRLRRDEANRATSRELYAQAVLPFGGGGSVGAGGAASPLEATAGVRSGSVNLSTADRYFSNGDDSGTLSYSWTNPVLGLRWKLSPQWALHASAARGFESPTLGELAYRPDGSAGFNTALQGQRSRQVELGSKWRSGGGAEIDAALFDIHTQNEIGVQANSGGRSTFQNVGRTRRYGLELAGALAFAGGWKAQAALTLLQATYEDGFLTCTATPCTTATVPVAAGKRIAGTQRGSLWAQLQTPAYTFGQFAAEWRAGSRLVANDTNTEAARGWAVLNLRWSKRFDLGAGQSIEALLRLDNAAGKTYAGSVIVNDGNGRFYEPASPRHALVALRWQQRW